jgi:AraC family transcriptional regulator
MQSHDLIKSNHYVQAINIAIDYIHLHLNELLSLEAVAREVSFSPYHFHRIFKSIVQETLHQYIRRARIEKSEKLLVFHEGIPVRDIAFECGFESLSCFSRAFKDMRGLAPTDYRKRYALNMNRDMTFAEQRFRQEIAALSTLGSIGGIDRVISYALREIHKVTIQHIPAQKVAYTRHRGLIRGLNPQLSRSFENTFKEVRRHGLLSSDSQALGVSHDDTNITPLHKCRYDACVTVNPDSGPIPGIESQLLPGGKYAVLTISDTPTVSWLLGDLLVQQWLPASGYQLDMRPFLEKFYNNPVHDPYQRAIFDFCVPVRPKTRQIF